MSENIGTNYSSQKNSSRKIQGNNSNQLNSSLVPLQNSLIYKKFLNILMKSGEKHVAENILYTSCLLFGKNSATFSHILVTAIRNVKPLVQLATQKNKRRSFRKAGSSVVPVPSNRGYKMAIDSIIEGARRRKRSDGSMAFRLYSEIIQAYEKKGYAFKKKVEIHLQCKQDKS